MKSTDELIQQLQEQASFDSDGSFSVDFVDQARRLSVHYESLPELPILLALQAAVQCGVATAEVRLGRDELSVEGLSLSASDQSLPNPLLQKAVQVLLAQGYQEVELWCRNSREGSRWLVQGRQVSLPDSSAWPLKSGFRLVARSLPQPWWARLLPNRRRARIHSEVSRRTGFYPIPLRLDGRSLNQPEPELCELLTHTTSKSAGLEMAHFSYVWLAETLELADTGPALALGSPLTRPACETQVAQQHLATEQASPHVAIRRLPSDRAVLTHQQPERFIDGNGSNALLQPGEFPLASHLSYDLNGTLVPRRTFYWEGCWALLLPEIPRRVPNSDQRLPSVRASRWLGLSIMPVSVGRLCYVQHGIALDPVPIDVGCQCLIASSTIQTDMSGLTVVTDAEFASDRDWAARQTLELVQACKYLTANTKKCELFRIALSIRQAWRDQQSGPV